MGATDASSTLCWSDRDGDRTFERITSAPPDDGLAAEVAAAQDVAAELRHLLDRYSNHLSAATRIFDETVSHTAGDSWIELCHRTGVAALWAALGDFRRTLEDAAERASGREPARATGLD